MWVLFSQPSKSLVNKAFNTVKQGCLTAPLYFSEGNSYPFWKRSGPHHPSAARPMIKLSAKIYALAFTVFQISVYLSSRASEV